MNTHLSFNDQYDPSTGQIEITSRCPMCLRTKNIVVNTQAFTEWYEGDKKIQDAFPNLTIDEREALMTGYCGPCWRYEFGEEY